MRCLLLTAIFYLIMLPVKSQTAEQIIAELKSISKKITDQSCSTGNSQLITNRAMSAFLARETICLSESGDIDFFTNTVAVNTTEGRFSSYHNFHKSKGMDDPVKNIASAGISLNINNGFAGAFLNKKFENELSAIANYKWLGKVKTRSAACTPGQSEGNQKMAMDGLRASILYSLEIEITKREAEFIQAIDNIEAADIPGHNIPAAKALIMQNFYQALKDEYTEKFARLQAEALFKTNNYHFISTGWTNLSVDVPLSFPRYTVAQSLTAIFQEKHPYPFYVMLGHTRFWESNKFGRLILTFTGKAFLNNSKLGYALNQTDFAGYKVLGGTDTLHLSRLKNDHTYIGNYKTFVTPSLTGRLVYFPANSHLGISFLLEQNFGSYNLLNGRLGIPFILINSKKVPATCVEFFVTYFDISNKINNISKPADKVSIGFGVGLPLSRLIY